MSIKKTLLLVIPLLLSVLASNANHVLGGHFSYTCLGGNTYGVTLTYYSDCFGSTSAPPLQFINLTSAGDVCPAYTTFLDFVSETNISDLCASEQPYSSCNNGVIPGTNEIVYYSEITLDPSCNWNIVWEGGDFNYFANTNNTVLNNVFFEVDIDATVACEETLDVTSMNVPYYCSGDAVSQTPVFNNPNGYDLTYSLVTPMANGGVPITGFFDIPGITIDPVTGEITFVAPITAVTQSYSVAIEVTSSLGGIPQGTYIENMAFIIRNCDPAPTVFSTPPTFDHHIDLNVITSSNFEACVGDSINFYISAENANIFSGVGLTANLLGTPFENAQFTIEGVNPAIGYFTILATDDMSGSNSITFDAISSDCINPSSDSFEVTINVSSQLLSNVMDSTVCVGSNIDINVDQSNLVGWDFLVGTDPGIIVNSNTQSFEVTENLQIEITSLDPGALGYCNIADTINITAALSNITAVIVHEGCAEDNGSIQTTIGEGSGDYTYDWAPDGQTNPNINGLEGGDYTLTVFDDDIPGCSTDTTFEVLPIVLPTGSISSDVTICAGECYYITFDLTGTGPFTVDLYDNTLNELVSGGSLLEVENGDSIQVCPLVTTTYTLQEVADNHTPSCLFTDDVNIEVTIREIPSVSISEQDTICSGQELDVLINVNQPGFFNMFSDAYDDPQNFANGSTVPFEVNSPTTNFCVYNIEYPDGPFCTNDTIVCIDLVADSIPTASFVDNELSFCLGAGPFTADIEITGDPDGNWVADLNNINSNWILDSPLSEDLDLLFQGDTGTVTNCITYLENTSNGCINSTINECVTITYGEIPEGTITSFDNLLICEGETVELLVNLTSEAHIIVQEQSTGVNIVDSVEVTNFLTFDVTPTQTEDYILSLYQSTACSSLNIDTVSVEIHDSPFLVTPLDTICNENGETYILELGISGGDFANYETTILSTQGAFVDSVFTSVDIPSGLGAAFVFNDTDPCNLLYSSGIVTCPTISDGGIIVMDTAFCQNGQVCFTSVADSILDNNDVLNYAILSSNDVTTADILALSETSCWTVASDLSFPPFEYGVEYYGYAVVGNNNGAGLIDEGNTNYFSNGIPFTIYEEPVVSLTDDATICSGDSVAITLTFPGNQPITSIDVLLDNVVVETLTNITSPYEHFVFDAGDYTVDNITTAHCIGSSIESVTITVTELPSALITADATICQNESFDFAVDIVGAGNWNVTIENPDESTDVINYTGSDIYNATAAGEYTIISVVDLNTGCVSLDTNSSVVLTVNPLPEIDVETLNASYCSGQVLEFPVELIGESQWTIDYTFNAVPNSVTSVDPDTTLTIPINATGTLILQTITDGNSCVFNPNLEVNFTEITTPVSNPGIDFTICSGVSQIIGTPETVGYTYLWQGDISTINNINIAEPTLEFTNESGADQVYDLDLIVTNLGCSDTTAIEITLQSEPDVNAGLDINLCFGDETNLNGSGGDCLWSEIDDDFNASFVDLTTDCNALISPSVTTSYELTATGLNQCTAIDSVTVTVSEEFELAIEFTDSICFGTCEGSIEVEPSGGFGTYGITWTDPVTLTLMTEEDLCADTYTFTVFDENAVCSIDTMITITELDEYFSDLITSTNPTCFSGINSDNGSIEAVSTSGVNYYIDTVEDDNGDGVFNGLSAGDYVVQIENIHGCLTTDNVTLVSDSPQFNTDPDITSHIACFGDDVIISGSSNFDDADVTYTWYNCDPVDATCLYDSDADNQTMYTITEDITLYLIGVDLLGCNSDTTEILLELAEPLVIDCNIPSDLELCQGDSIVLMAIDEGGTNDREVTWFENGNELGTDNDYVVYPTVTSLYMAVVNDGCSAPASCSVNVIVHEQPVVPISANVYSGCFPLEVNFSKDAPVPNADILTSCIWNLGNGETQAVCSDVSFIYDVPGTYDVSLIVTSNEGCVGVSSIPEQIVVHGYPFADFSWTPEEITPLENEAQFINESIGGSLCAWTFSGLLQTNECDPYVEFPPGNIGEYDVCLISTSAFGCRDTTCKVVDIKNEVIVYIPSAFTPDLDGVNDFFYPVITGIDPADYLFQIVDQWGTLIFQTTDPDEKWRGDNRKGEYYVEPQTFNYMIKVSDVETGDDSIFRGRVTLVR